MDKGIAESGASTCLRGFVNYFPRVLQVLGLQCSCRQTVAPIMFSDCNHQKTQSFKAMIGFDWKIPIKSNFSYYKPIKKSDLTIKIPNHFGM